VLRLHKVHVAKSGELARRAWTGPHRGTHLYCFLVTSSEMALFISPFANCCPFFPSLCFPPLDFRWILKLFASFFFRFSAPAVTPLPPIQPVPNRPYGKVFAVSRASGRLTGAGGEGVGWLGEGVVVLAARSSARLAAWIGGGSRRV